MHARKGQEAYFTLTGRRLALFLAASLITAAILGAVLQRSLMAILPPQYTVSWLGAEQFGRDALFLRENVNMLAGKVGALQAKLASIDGLGERVAKLAGLNYAVPDLGASLADHPEATQVMDDLFTDRQPPTPTSAAALGRQLDEIQARLAQQTDNLKLLDVALTRRSADQARLPSAMPIKNYPYLSSSYGWRRHPLTGRYTMHEGLDFAAPRGTPILAASGGVVLAADYRDGYGNTVEIDHGDGLITRYAHASALLVQPGQLVERGQQIARVGTSGRSTGPHLHFEVRLADQPLDPRRFLGRKQTIKSAQAKAVVTAARSTR
jgi:murein DD-endopeptidase MepM/ murein hydrolase activator NlpD